MAQIGFTDLRTAGDIWIDDADNFALTSAAKDEMMRSAINDDPYVSKVIVDKSITTVMNQAEYTVDDSYDAIIELRLDVNGDGYGAPIDPSAYDYLDNTIIFTSQYKLLPATKNLIIRAKQKLYDYDVFDQILRSYILHNFAAGCLRVLMGRKTGRFLRNQTTMTELAMSLQEHERQAAMIRARLSNRVDVRL